MSAPAVLNESREKRMISSLAMMVSGIITSNQASALAGVPRPTLLATLTDQLVQEAVDAEVLRLKLSGELVNLKAATLTDSMLDKLLSTNPDELSIVIASRLAELGLKFRDKAPVAGAPDSPKMEIFILKDGDPRPVFDPNKYSLVINLSNKGHESLNDMKEVGNDD